jgi:ribonuclease PH
MIDSFVRHDGRRADQLRTLKVQFDVFGYAASSMLFELGNTKVLCAVTLQQGVPPFLKGSNTGWLNAEYSMLPTSTTVRTQRESSTQKKNGRNTEISRLISRALRSVVDLSRIGERTIMIDCDVLQADAGTRTACITASYFALVYAIERWFAAKEIPDFVLKGSIAAISAGVYQGRVVLDPDFAEDGDIDADFNFVITQEGDIIEVQGTAEKNPVTWQQFNQLRELALLGVNQLFTFFESQKPDLAKVKIMPTIAQHKNNHAQTKRQNNSLFSLGNRIKVVEE